MVHLISVGPFGDGWAVETDELANPMLFKSGSAAEAAARALAAKLAKAGQGAEVQIRLRDGAIAARFASPPRPR